MNRLPEEFSLDEDQLLPDYEFWTFIYQCCQQLEETSTDVKSLSHVVNKLETIIEAFDKTFDPADKYPEYLMVLFCRSILKGIRLDSLEKDIREY